MGLVVDRGWSDVESLRAHDSSVEDLAQQEGIDLEKKLASAESELRDEVEAELRAGSRWSIAQAVVCGRLERWQQLRALALVYRDAFFSQMNERYERRWKEFRKAALEARSRFWEAGIGMAQIPLRRPQAPSVTAEPGPHADRSYWVRAAWVNARGEESEASEPVYVDVPYPHRLKVELGPAAEGAAGWHCYAGPSADSTWRQAPGPVAAGAVWLQASAVGDGGIAPGKGQTGDAVASRRRILQRG